MYKKNLLPACSLLLGAAFCSAQNVGIGTTTPAKGRLEVVGVAGTGNTNAISWEQRNT